MSTDPVSFATLGQATATKTIVNPKPLAGINRPTATTTQAIVYMYSNSEANVGGPIIPTSGATVGRGMYTGTLSVGYNQGNGSAVFVASGTIANSADSENLCQLINNYLAGDTRLGSMYVLECRLVGSTYYGGGGVNGAWKLCYGGPKTATWNDNGTLRKISNISGLYASDIYADRGMKYSDWKEFSQPSGTAKPGSAAEHTWQIWASNNSTQASDMVIYMKEYEIQFRLRGREEIGSTQLGVTSLKLKGISMDSGDKLQLNNDPTLILACPTPGVYDSGCKAKDKTSLNTNMSISSVKRLAGCPLVVLEY